MTIRELVAAHPDWLDLPLVVYTDQGYEYVGASARVYEDFDVIEDSKAIDPTRGRVVVFTGN